MANNNGDKYRMSVYTRIKNKGDKEEEWLRHGKENW